MAWRGRLDGLVGPVYADGMEVSPAFLVTDHLISTLDCGRSVSCNIVSYSDISGYSGALECAGGPRRLTAEGAHGMTRRMFKWDVVQS